MNKLVVFGLIGVIVLVGLFVFQYTVIQESDFACSLTVSNPSGPYYLAGAPLKEKLGMNLQGQRLVITGQVLNQNCQPIPNSTIDLWQTDSNGNYYQDFTLRGKIITDDVGNYFINTIFPGKYSDGNSIRPAHLHLKISGPETSTLTTQLYFEDDQHHDSIVREELILQINETNGIKYSEFDFVIFDPVK